MPSATAVFVSELNEKSVEIGWPGGHSAEHVMLSGVFDENTHEISIGNSDVPLTARSAASAA